MYYNVLPLSFPSCMPSVTWFYGGFYPKFAATTAAAATADGEEEEQEEATTTTAVGNNV